jgi:hypothetical protein
MWKEALTTLSVLDFITRCTDVGGISVKVMATMQESISEIHRVSLKQEKFTHIFINIDIT